VLDTVSDTVLDTVPDADAVSDAVWMQRSDGWVARVDLRIKNGALDPISIGPNNFKLDGKSYDLSETARCNDFPYSQ
jgi:hypothetical protein